jgi:HD-GYP domain-containing protein (c-di-GMP phosphodiesterase class II)
MSHYEATAILNAIRRGEGKHFSRQVIDMALRLTGDLE